MENILKRTYESLILELFTYEEESSSAKNILNYIYIKIKNENSNEKTETLLNSTNEGFKDILKICKNHLSSNNDLKRKLSLSLINKILLVVGNLKLNFEDIKDLINLSIEKMMNVVLAQSAVKMLLSKIKFY